MAKTIVSIISAQPTPNYFLIKELFEIGDKLMFITSTQMKNNIQPIVNTLGWKNVEIKNVTLSNGEEEKWDAMCEKIKQAISHEEQYAVNLTGGTKYMALAVQSVFEKYSSEFYYIPYPKNVILTKNSSKPINTKLSVEEYMQLHGHTIRVGETAFSSGLSEKMLKSFTTKWTETDFSILAQLRNYRNNNKIKISWVEQKDDQKNRPSIPGLKAFLERNEFTTQNDDELTKYETQYLTGGWFEEYVYYMIKKELDVTDICLGVKLNTTNNDLDVVFTKDNRLFVIECKTGIDGGGMLNSIAYKSAALNDYLKGLSSHSYIFALSPNNAEWSRIPQAMDIGYYGRDYFIDDNKKQELIANLRNK